MGICQIKGIVHALVSKFWLNLLCRGTESQPQETETSWEWLYELNIYQCHDHCGFGLRTSVTKYYFKRKKERRKADRQAHSEWPGALGQLTQ